MIGMAEDSEDALILALSLLREMKICAEEFLTDDADDSGAEAKAFCLTVIGYLYDSYVPYSDSLAFKIIKERLALVYIRVLLKLGWTELAENIFQSLPPVNDDARRPVFRLRQRQTLALAEEHLFRGDDEKALKLLHEFFSTLCGGKFIRRWLNLASALAESFSAKEDLNSLVMLYDRIKLFSSKSRRCLSVVFGILRNITELHLSSGKFKEAVGFYRKLTEDFAVIGKTASLRRVRNMAARFLLSGLCRKGRADDALKLWFSLPLSGRKALSPLTRARTGRLILKDFAARGRLSEARKIFESLASLKSQRKVDVIRGRAALCLVRACEKLNLPDSALELFKRIPAVCDPRLVRKAMLEAAASLSGVFAGQKKTEKFHELRGFLENIGIR